LPFHFVRHNQRDVYILILIFLYVSTVPVFGSITSFSEVSYELFAFGKAYPEARFAAHYNTQIKDWEIHIVSNSFESVLYYAGGRYLSPGQLKDKDQFKSLLYRLPYKTLDPALFIEDRISRIADFGSTEKRSNGPVTSPAFFNALHDISTRSLTESHIVPVSFLHHRFNAHSSIEAKLKRIEPRIMALSETDSSVDAFIRELQMVGGYVWRTVRDTPGRSLHGMGLAVDFLPGDRKYKIIY